MFIGKFGILMFIGIICDNNVYWDYLGLFIGINSWDIWDNNVFWDIWDNNVDWGYLDNNVYWDYLGLFIGISNWDIWDNNVFWGI